MKLHTAKKEHVCSLCGQKIPAGHRYWRDYVANGRGETTKDEKQHTNCSLYEVKLTADTRQ